MAQVQIERNKAVNFNDKEQKAASQLGVVLPALTHTKFIIPAELETALNAELAQVLESYLNKLEPLRDAVDSENGDGFFQSMQDKHIARVTLWSPKQQTKTAKEIAATNGDFPSAILGTLATTATATDSSEDLGISLEL